MQRKKSRDIFQTWTFNGPRDLFTAKVEERELFYRVHSVSAMKRIALFVLPSPKSVHFRSNTSTSGHRKGPCVRGDRLRDRRYKIGPCLYLGSLVGGAGW